MFGSAKIYTDKSHIYMELLTERYIYIYIYNIICRHETCRPWYACSAMAEGANCGRFVWAIDAGMIQQCRWFSYVDIYILYIHMYIAGFTWTCTSRRCQLSALIWTGNRIICLFLFHIYIYTYSRYIYIRHISHSSIFEGAGFVHNHWCRNDTAMQ